MYTIYLKEYYDDSEIWHFDVDNVELIAGMLAVSMGILEEYNYRINENIIDNATNVNNGTDKEPNKIQYYFDSNVDVSKYRVVADVLESDIKNVEVGYVKPGYLGVWLKGNSQFHYNLFAFRNNQFFQGIFTICKLFNVDFRTCMYQYPFDSLGEKYEINGFTIIPKEVCISVPNLLHDRRMEQMGNENVIELLRKDY